MTVLLNGKFVEDDKINPEKHKFIGMFRRPYTMPNGIVLCPCGKILEYQQITYEHYLAGHCDLPQYINIE